MEAILHKIEIQKLKATKWIRKKKATKWKHGSNSLQKKKTEGRTQKFYHKKIIQKFLIDIPQKQNPEISLQEKPHSID